MRGYIVTLPGIVTLVRLAEKTRIPFPMAVTSRLLILVGMATTVLVPVYPVMVMVFVSSEFMV